MPARWIAGLPWLPAPMAPAWPPATRVTTKAAAARSKLRLAIEDTLDRGLPRAYTPELFGQKCAALFEQVYESYPERDAGVYA